MFEYCYLVDLPYNLAEMQVGYEDKSKFEAARLAHLAFIGKQTSLLMTAYDYAKSYLQSKDLTLLQIRDYLISRAILYSLDNLLFYNANARSLTGHAEKALSQFAAEEFYPDVISGFGFPSRFGSLLGLGAFYFVFTKAEGYPLDYYTELLTLFWHLQGVNYTDTPKTRLEKLLKLAGHQASFDNYVEQCFRELFAVTDPQHEHYSILLYARRQALSADNGLNFTNNVLAGTYPPAIFNVLAQLLPELRYSKVKGFADNVLSIAKPVGFPLVTQMLAVEGCLKAAQILNNLNPELANQSKANFFQDPTNNTVRDAVAAALTTAVDALTFQVDNNIRDRTTVFADLNYLKDLAQEWAVTSIASGAPTRLSPILKTQVLESTGNPSFASEFYTELLKRPPSGLNSIVLKGDAAIGDSLSYVAVNYGQSSPPSILLLSESTTSPVTVVAVEQKVLSLEAASSAINNPQAPLPADSLTTLSSLVGVTRIVVSPISTTAVVAVDGNQYNNLDIVSVTALPSTGDTEDMSTSNVLLAAPPSNDKTRLEQDIELGLRRVRGQYVSYASISSVEQPRGSTEDSYRILGLATPAMSVAQNQTLYKDKIDGSYEDYIGRMSHLTLQASEVHTGSEIQAVEQWLKTLPVGTHKTV